MNAEDFDNQDCFVLIPRLAYAPYPKNGKVREEFTSEEGYSKSKLLGPKSARMSRNTRKRTSVEEDNPSQHNNKTRNGLTLGSKKVKFGMVYEPGKDRLVFSDLDSEKYVLVQELVPPTFSDSNSDHCFFPLNKSQSKKISIDNYVVLLRLTYFNKQSEKYEDIFDYGMEVKINDVMLPLTVATPDDPSAPLEGPADITRYLMADGNTIERVKITFEGSAKPHIFSIVFAKTKKDELPFVTLRYCEPNQTLKLVMRDSEKYDWDRSKVYRKIYPLVDPISQQRIEIPVRGHKCSHVEVFDKDTFLKTNRRKIVWKCPICSDVIQDDQLVVDGLIFKILSCTFSSCHKIELNSYGGWSPVYKDKVFRSRLVDIENDYSEGEEYEDEPLGPESPVDIPPQPELLSDNSMSIEMQNGDADNVDTAREMDATEVRQIETQTEENMSDGADYEQIAQTNSLF